MLELRPDPFPPVESSYVVPQAAVWSRPGRMTDVSRVWRAIFVVQFLALLVVVFVRSEAASGFALCALVLSGFADLFYLAQLRERPIETGPATPEQEDELSVTEGDAWLVDLTVRRDGKVIGYDRGILKHADHAMHFGGSRTNFLIGSQDLSPRKELWDTVRRDREGTKLGHMLRLRGFTAGLELDLVEVPVGRDRKARRALGAALEDFKVDAVPTTLERSFPPIANWRSRIIQIR